MGMPEPLRVSGRNDPRGTKLGRIVHGHDDTTNMAFGGDDWKTLFITTRFFLTGVNLRVPGVPVPVSRKT
jgi:gluconolactonase